MNRIVSLVLIASIFALHTCAQAPGIQWAKCYGGSSDDIPAYILQTGDGGYAVAGITLSNDGDVTVNYGQNDEWIVKLDSSGNLQWQKSYGGSNQDKAKSIKQTGDGGYIIGGYTFSDDGEVTGNHGYYDYWLVKIDSVGTLQWQKCIGGTEDDLAYALEVTRDSGFIMAGKSKSSNGDATFNRGGFDFWVVKTDDTGSIQWQKSYGGSNDDVALAIRQTRDGGYVVAGYTESNDSDVTESHGGADYWVVKLDAAGNMQWQKTLGGSGADTGTFIQQCSDGGYIVAGYSYSNDGDVTGNHGSCDYWLVKLDSSGTMQWQKSLGGSQAELAYSAGQSSDGGYFVTGYSFSEDGDITGHHGDTTTSDYWVVKTDSAGNIQWEESLGGTNFDISIVYSNAQTPDGGYIVAGASESTDGDVTGHKGTSTNADYWVVKLGTITGIENPVPDALGFSLYPNPTTGNITIETQMPVAGSINADIKNTLGQSLYSFRENAIAGWYKKSIDLNFAPGIYYLSLQTGSGKLTKRLELVK